MNIHRAALEAITKRNLDATENSFVPSDIQCLSFPVRALQQSASSFHFDNAKHRPTFHPKKKRLKSKEAVAFQFPNLDI